ncbi:MAG TPA: NAD(P)-binding domain-containing protein [Ktedonobacterales bacterium]
MAHTEQIKTVVIGGGQAGLATSYWLTQWGHPHLVLEQAVGPGHVWRDERWDSFTLVTPNWMVRLPGAVYQGGEPDGFLLHEEIVAYFARYAEQFRLPIQYGTRVVSVEHADDGTSFHIQTKTTQYEAANVVIATGVYQHPKIPAWSARLPAEVAQIHSGGYRRPDALVPGAVLVVGSGQSGCQIAEELYQSGRTVYLGVGRAGRMPRRYRGLDAFAWAYLMGTTDRTVNELSSPQERLEAHPHLSGKDGGHTLNLHRFVRDGVVLLGHLRDADEGRLLLAPDVHESLAAADKVEADFCDAVDRYVTQSGMDAPQEALPTLMDGYAHEAPTELELASVNIRTVIWAMGYTFDFSFVKMPIHDAMGYPVQAAGITRVPGLYFVGLPWLRTRGSGLLFGVGNDAAWIATDIARRAR